MPPPVLCNFPYQRELLLQHHPRSACAHRNPVTGTARNPSSYRVRDAQPCRGRRARRRTELPADRFEAPPEGLPARVVRQPYGLCRGAAGPLRALVAARCRRAEPRAEMAALIRFVESDDLVILYYAICRAAAVLVPPPPSPLCPLFPPTLIICFSFYARCCADLCEG